MREPFRPQPSPPALPHERQRERVLLLVVLVLILLSLIGPVVPQPLNFHDFADQRAWDGLPRAMDVLSNLPFALWGLAGAVALVHAARLRAVDLATIWLTALFFGGLVITAAVSAMYHWQPDNAGLLWDRGGMVLAFAGMLGLAARQGVSARAGIVLALLVLVLGPMSLQVWTGSGNLLPWGTLQFGGMSLIVWLVCLRRDVGGASPGLPIRWALVIGLYALAKVLELGDHAVFEATGHFVSGHSLKHLVASCAAWPVFAALRNVAKSRAEFGSPSGAGSKEADRRTGPLAA